MRWGRIRVQCHITLRQLEILLLVIEQSSFRKAAAALGLSPVAVGEHIRALEDRLRVSLFHRRSLAASAGAGPMGRCRHRDGRCARPRPRRLPRPAAERGVLARRGGPPAVRPGPGPGPRHVG
ncbi:MAG: LysR family transcriptional regulator, partial [Novosphingobium sp.]